MNEALIKRLRNTANAVVDWDDDNLNPPFTEWAALLDEAADALEAFEEDEA
jgi:hypothetical protein